MKRFAAILLGVFALVVVYGCTGATPPADDDSPNSTASNAGVSSGLPATPDGAVKEFLTALRLGDDRLAMSLMTSKAQVASKSNDMRIEPPGSPNATFTIDEIDYLENDRPVEGEDAQVLSTWRDVDQEGRRQTYAIVWLVGKEGSGWAIMGMATKVFPDAAPLVLNFEEPQELLLRREAVKQELARRSNAGQPQQRVATEDPVRR